jgi:hypothetical protein
LSTIAQIGPLVQGGLRREYALLLHIIGGALGGIVVGSVLCLGGLTLRTALQLDMPGVLTTALPVLAIWAIVVDLRVFPLPAISPARQTTRGWVCALGPFGAALAWGIDLGLMVTTRINYQAYLVILAFAFLSGNLPASILATGTYGLARAIGVAGIVEFRGVEWTAASCDLINSKQHAIRSAAIVWCSLVAAFLAFV